MPRYAVRLSDRESGSRVEYVVSIEADSRRDARKMALALYGSDGTEVVSVQAERYFEHRQHLFFWTPNRLEDGTFAAIEYVPIGRGSRTGTATRLRHTREARFHTRKAAREQAQKWYEAAKAKDVGPAAEGAARNESR